MLAIYNIKKEDALLNVPSVDFFSYFIFVTTLTVFAESVYPHCQSDFYLRTHKQELPPTNDY